MMAKVSVVIPCYNSERFLRETLQSVSTQTFDDYEIIVVDDGSTDGTRLVLEDFPTVQYHYQSNQGPAIARNTGLNLATGAYVAFMDSDDLWHPKMLQTCVEVLETRSDIHAVHVNWVSIDINGKVIEGSGGWQPWRGDIFDRLLVSIPILTDSVVWRRECWDQIGGFDLTPEINDDWINWLRIAHLGCQFEAIEHPLVYRRMHQQSITWVQSQRVIQWRLNALERICNEYDVEESLRRAAYAEVYWVSTVKAVSQGRFDDASNAFRLAVCNDPDLLSQRSTFFGLACGGVAPRQKYAPPSAQENLMSILDGLFSSAELPAVVHDQEDVIRAKALFVLAQIAYGAGEHDALARRLLGRSLRMNLSTALDRQSVLWVARILLGRRLVRLGHRATAPVVAIRANANR